MKLRVRTRKTIKPNRSDHFHLNMTELKIKITVLRILNICHVRIVRGPLVIVLVKYAAIIEINSKTMIKHKNPCAKRKKRRSTTVAL
jgi:hypothetical protein